MGGRTCDFFGQTRMGVTTFLLFLTMLTNHSLAAFCINYLGYGGKSVALCLYYYGHITTEAPKGHSYELCSSCAVLESVRTLHLLQNVFRDYNSGASNNSLNGLLVEKAHLLLKHLPELVERQSHLWMFWAQMFRLYCQGSPKQHHGLFISALVESTCVMVGVTATQRCSQRVHILRTKVRTHK